uniref:Uncharacterized protein n=1 Tax=Lepeophtheirus salmonis TaxID=72036 RepID=A0A0K2T949_LEPSM
MLVHSPKKHICTVLAI